MSTVVFICCMGSIALHAATGLTDKTTRTTSNLPNQLQAKRLKVSVHDAAQTNMQVQEKEMNRLPNKEKNAAVASVNTEGRSRAAMISVLILMGAIAVRRILSLKF